MSQKSKKVGTKNLCGARIRLARELKAKKDKVKFTIVDLMAALVDYDIKMDTSALARLERQERLITDKELLAISEILEVSMEWLLKGSIGSNLKG